MVVIKLNIVGDDVGYIDGDFVGNLDSEIGNEVGSFVNLLQIYWDHHNHESGAISQEISKSGPQYIFPLCCKPKVPE